MSIELTVTSAYGRQSEELTATDNRVNLWLLLVLPGLLTALAFIVLNLYGLDATITGWFYDPSLARFPLKHNFWLEDVLHDGGRRVMIGILLAIIILWAASLISRAVKPYRSDLAYLSIAIIIGVSTVSIGKQLTNVDCPWDLDIYGGDRPHVSLFADKPDSLPVGKCFPGGHSSSGFALFALYFVGLGGRKHRWTGLLPAMIVGGIFSVAQWSRGAHFPSHDLISAWICWTSAVLTYHFFRFTRQRARR